MQRQEQLRMGHDLIDAFNRADWASFRATLAPGVVYEESGTGRRAEGPDAYIGLLEGWHRALPDVHGRITSTALDGNTVAQRISWSATHTNPLEAPGMTIPPTGRRVEVESVNWLTFENGRVVRAWHHLDVMGMLLQLGVLGEPSVQHA